MSARRSCFPSALALCLGLVALGPAPAAAAPLRDGEKLTYRVSWAVLPGAGEIKISAATGSAPFALPASAPSAASPQLLVTTATRTRGVARMLMPFDAEARSVFDLATGRLVALQETSAQRSKRSEHSVTFDHASRLALYVRPGAADGPRPLPFPAGDPTDLILGLLQTRTWDLAPDAKRDTLVLFDDDFYELTIYRTRDEEVRTSLGTFRAAVLEPRMEKTAPKGMFKRGSTVRVWISQDERRLPVKFEVEFKVGTGTATLDAYEPPRAGAAALPAPAPPAATVAPAATPAAARPAPASPDGKDSRP